MLNSIRALSVFLLVLAGPCVASAQGSLPVNPGDRVELELVVTNSAGVEIPVPADAKWALNMQPKTPTGAFPITFPVVAGNGPPGVLTGVVGDLPPGGPSFFYSNLYMTVEGTLDGIVYAVNPSAKFQLVAKAGTATPVPTQVVPTPSGTPAALLVPRNAALKVRRIK